MADLTNAALRRTLTDASTSAVTLTVDELAACLWHYEGMLLRSSSVLAEAFKFARDKVQIDFHQRPGNA